MNFEKTMCDRLGYKYKYVFENVLYVIHHLPYAKEYINEEILKLLEELDLKINTGEIEIIEFTRPLYKCLDVDEIVKENKALRLLLNWAEECDWGFDNFRDDDVVNWEEFEKVSKNLDYIESMIKYAEMYLESKGE